MCWRVYNNETLWKVVEFSSTDAVHYLSTCACRLEYDTKITPNIVVRWQLFRLKGLEQTNGMGCKKKQLGKLDLRADTIRILSIIIRKLVSWCRELTQNFGYFEHNLLYQLPDLQAIFAVCGIFFYRNFPSQFHFARVGPLLVKECQWNGQPKNSITASPQSFLHQRLD